MKPGSLSPTTAGADYILERGKLLGLPTRMARSDLTLQDNFVVA